MPPTERGRPSGQVLFRAITSAAVSGWYVDSGAAKEWVSSAFNRSKASRLMRSLSRRIKSRMYAADILAGDVAAHIRGDEIAERAAQPDGHRGRAGHGGNPPMILVFDITKNAHTTRRTRHSPTLPVVGLCHRRLNAIVAITAQTAVRNPIAPKVRPIHAPP